MKRLRAADGLRGNAPRALPKAEHHIVRPLSRDQVEILVGQVGHLSSKDLLNEVLVDLHFVVVQSRCHVRQPLALGWRLAFDATSERRDVVVDVEQIGGIVAPLHLNEPLVVAAVRGAYPRSSVVLHHHVHVAAG
jgi:hypothetical protein